MNLMLERAKKEDNDFKDRRLKFIQDGIRGDMTRIFPNENTVPTLEYRTLRGKRKARLVLVDKYGKRRAPKNSASGLMKQLISFTGSISTGTLIGSNKFFIDEAFGASSVENKGKLGTIIGEFTDKGLQIILISQSGELYQDLDRREHLLVKTGDMVKLIDVKDWSGLNEANI
ncbi:MAG: hypothetical protein ACRC5M_02515 [Anaeroplasmataceae bacterium]